MLTDCTITKTANEYTIKEDSITTQLKWKDTLLRKEEIIDANTYLQHLNNSILNNFQKYVIESLIITQQFIMNIDIYQNCLPIDELILILGKDSSTYKDITMTTQYNKEQTIIQAQIQINKEMLDVNDQLIEAQGINVNNCTYFNQVVAEEQNAVQTPPNPELQKPKRKKRSRRKYSIGKWNELEKAKYYLFLLDYKQQFRPKVFIQKEQLFKKMSEHIHSRSRVQCRSHHQKQQQKKRTYQQFFVDLYNQVKDHPLLANHQPIIQNKIQNLFKQQIPVQQNNIIPNVPASPVIIFEYKPNYDHYPISEIQYRKLFHSKPQ